MGKLADSHLMPMCPSMIRNMPKVNHCKCSGRESLFPFSGDMLPVIYLLIAQHWSWAVIFLETLHLWGSQGTAQVTAWQKFGLMLWFFAGLFSPFGCRELCVLLVEPQPVHPPRRESASLSPVAVQEREMCDTHPTSWLHTIPSQGILWMTSDIFQCQELTLPGKDAQASGFYLSRRMYLPFRHRLLLKWMENQRNEVRIIP